MELKRIIEKIGKDKFKAAMQADDKAALGPRQIAR